MGDIHPDDPMRGRIVDDQGRCIHAEGKNDIVCFRFPDENWEFWACKECHDFEVGEPKRLWNRDETKELAVQCGICRSILGIQFYIERQHAGEHSCPHCKAPWNPDYADGRDIVFAF
jgi:uncharacterized CHY-type Zn-finger protein